MRRSVKLRLFLLLVLAALVSGIVSAQHMPVRRVPLNDEISLLDTATAKEVKQISQLLYRDHKSEMAVLIVRTTGGQDAGVYAERVFNNWGLGQAGINNGMLILFAIDDRRVEIKPGIRYRDHFTGPFCTSLLTRLVVPEMKAGRAASGVLAAAREVAAEIRVIEERAPGAAVSHNRPSESGQVGTAGLPGEKTAAASPAVKTSAKNRPPVVRPPRKGFSLPALKLDGVRLVIFAFILLVIAGGGYYYYEAYYNGRLLMPVWMMVLLVLLLTVISVWLVRDVADFFDGALDPVFTGAGAIAVGCFLWCASHVCPRCNKYMNVYTRTLTSATYYSSGLGEKTEHCENCGHHRVSTYTISRKQRSSSSSGGRSSSGGGRSSGGGGGASW